jgi:hypothetical protein
MVTSNRIADWGISDMGQTRNACRVLVEKPDDKRKLEQPDINGMITLKWISRGRMRSETTFGSEFGPAVPVP